MGMRNKNIIKGVNSPETLVWTVGLTSYIKNQKTLIYKTLIIFLLVN